MLCTFASLNASETENCSETDQKERHAVEDQGNVRCFIGKGEGAFCARFRIQTARCAWRMKVRIGAKRRSDYGGHRSTAALVCS